MSRSSNWVNKLSLPRCGIPITTSSNPLACASSNTFATAVIILSPPSRPYRFTFGNRFAAQLSNPSDFASSCHCARCSTGEIGIA